MSEEKSGIPAIDAQVDELKGLLHGIQTKNDERAEQIEKYGNDVGLLQQEVKSMSSDFEKKFTNLERVATRLGNAGNGKNESVMDLSAFNKMSSYVHKNNRELTEETANSYKNAFENYIKHGERALEQSEVKELLASKDTAGGYLVAPQYDQTIIQKQFDGHGVLEAVGKQSTSGHFVEIVDKADYSDAYFSPELVAASSASDNEDFVDINFYNKEIIYSKKFSRTALEDIFTNVESYVLNKMREGAMRTVAGKVINGTGVNQPRGILQYTAGTTFGTLQQITSGTSGSLTWADVISTLPAGLKDAYHGNAAFAMRRASFFALLAEVASTSGDYQLGNMINFFSGQGFSLNILGYPVKFEADMPAVAANALAVAFGDFDKGYLLTETPAVSLIRNETNPKYIEIHQRNRYDGKVRDFDAIKILKIKA